MYYMILAQISPQFRLVNLTLIVESQSQSADLRWQI